MIRWTDHGEIGMVYAAAFLEACRFGANKTQAREYATNLKEIEERRQERLREAKP